MGALLALASAACYGVVDFVGGLLARRVHGFALALVAQISGFLTMAAIALLSEGSEWNLEGLGWGAASGIGSGIAIMFLYRGMGRGQISLIVPLSAVAGAALPALVGIAVLGERPTALALAGIGLVLPALWLVSRNGGSTGPTTTDGFADAMAAGLGVALQYAAIAQASGTAWMWPLAANRLASVLVILAYARMTGVGLRMPPAFVLPAALIGAVAAASLALYLVATRYSLMTVAVVLASLYPAIPVVLGILMLKERLTAAQKIGLAASGCAIVLIAAA